MMVAGNFAPGNAGVPFYTDVICPVLTIALAIIAARNRARFRIEGTGVDKQKKTAAELEDIVKQRIGADDFKVTVHADPETGWHVMIHGR
jgi:hypothetical protein